MYIDTQLGWEIKFEVNWMNRVRKRETEGEPLNGMNGNTKW